MKTKKLPEPLLHGRRYPWDEWLIRGSVTLKQGRDFDCMPWVMAQMVRNRARKLKMSVSVSIFTDSISATFTRRKPNAKDQR